MKRFVILALLASTGCGKPAPRLKAVAAPPLAQGWTEAIDGETRVSFALPPGWRVGVPGRRESTAVEDPNAPPPSDAMAQLSSQMNQFEEKQEKTMLADLRDKGVVLHAVDGSTAIIAEEWTRIFVERFDKCPNLESAVARERDRMPNEDKGKPFETPIGKAWVLETKGRNRIGDMVREITYLFPDGERAWALHMNSTNNPDVFEPIRAEVAASFRRN